MLVVEAVVVDVAVEAVVVEATVALESATVGVVLLPLLTEMLLIVVFEELFEPMEASCYLC